jgi:hypothetical protein
MVEMTDAEKIFFILKRLCRDTKMTDAYIQTGRVRYYYDGKENIEGVLVSNSGDFAAFDEEMIERVR